MAPKKKPDIRPSSSEDPDIMMSEDDIAESPLESSPSEDDREVDPNYKKQAKTIEEVDIYAVYAKLPLLPLHPENAPLELKCDNVPHYNKSELDANRKNTDGWGTRMDVGKRKERQKIIALILQRWWFVFPMWPPRNFDWEGELRKRNYRLVELADWEKAEDVEDGYSKVWSLKMYPGLFRDVKGKLIDFRPKETCPCYANLNRKTLEELITYLEHAYENQIRVMKEHPTYESDKMISKIGEELRSWRQKKSDLIRKASTQQAKAMFEKYKETMRKM